MLDLKKRKIANLRHFLSQLQSLRNLGVLEERLGMSLNGVIKKYDLFDSNYRMIELSALWKKHGNGIESAITDQLAILEQEERELTILIDRAIEIFKEKEKLPSVNALLFELGLGEKKKSYKDELSCHLRNLVAMTIAPNVNFDSQEGTDVQEKLILHFSDPNFGKISKKQVADQIRIFGFLVSKRELQKFWQFINQQGRAPKINTYFSISQQENEAITQIASALNVSNGAAVSVMIRGALHLMASQNINAVGFLEHSKKLGSMELNFISKFFSKISI